MDNFSNDDEFQKDFMRMLEYFYKYGGLIIPPNREISTPKIDNNDPYSYIEKMLRSMGINPDDMINIKRGDGIEEKVWKSSDGNTSFRLFSAYPDQFSTTNDEPEVDLLAELKIKLDNAVNDERYEDAVKLRDVIKSLEEENKTK